METPCFAFAGTPPFAARILGGLLRNSLRPALILTRPDRKQGRGRRLAPSAVKRLATAEGIPAATPAGKAEAVSALAGCALDTVVVAAYGLLLPPAFLDQPRYGCINAHASLLPRWRGAAPIERAIMAGDKASGVSIMQIDEGLDTGPLIAQAKLPIGPRSTGADLSDAMADLSAELLCGVLHNLSELQAAPQEGETTYAGKLTPSDAKADWRGPAEHLERRIRALGQRLPVHSLLGDARVQLLAGDVVQSEARGRPGEILAASRKEILVACGEDALSLRSLRLNLGKGAVLGPAEAMNGYGGLFRLGACFHDP